MINFAINDKLLVNTSYLNTTFKSATTNNNSLLVSAYDMLHALIGKVVNVLDVGHTTIATTPFNVSFIQVVPLDVFNSAYNNGFGVTIYFVSDNMLNNSFELSTAFIGDVIYNTVINKTVAILPKGSIVRQTGFDPVSQLATIGLADSALLGNSIWLGVLTEDIAPNMTGSVLIEGSYQPVNTNGTSVTDPIYLNTVPGTFSLVPVGVNVVVGHILSVGADGSIFIRGEGVGSAAAGNTGIQGVTGIGFSFRGTWLPGTTYNQGDVVTYNGVNYVSLINGNTGNQPDTSPSDWASAFQGVTGLQGSTGIGFSFKGTWLPGTTYNQGDVVTYNGINYVSIINGNTGNQPDTNPSDWAASFQGVTGLQGATGIGFSFKGTWLPGTTYNQGDTVTYNNVTYVSLINGNTGNQPDTNPTDWAPGFQGQTGIQGLGGGTGIQGIQGITGVDGLQGITGFLGIDGITGTQGVQGITGADGLQGVTGFQGIDGITGFQGITGSVGLDSTGVQGLTGLQGVAGDTGFGATQGVTGLVGYTGLSNLGLTWSDVLYNSGNSNGQNPTINSSSKLTITNTGTLQSDSGATTSLNGQSVTWPSTSGSNHDLLATNGSGTWSWTTPKMDYANNTYTTGTNSGSNSVNLTFSALSHIEFTALSCAIYVTTATTATCWITGYSISTNVVTANFSWTNTSAGNQLIIWGTALQLG